MGYSLTDDIYPKWLMFLKTILCPNEPKRALLPKNKSPLKRKMMLDKQSGRTWHKEVFAIVIYVSIILQLKNVVAHDIPRSPYASLVNT